jgi:hypothetical protein
MSTLLERAKSLISNKPAMLGALAIVPLATAARNAEAGFAGPYAYSGGSVVFHTNASGDTTIPGTLSGIGSNPLTLSTNGTIDVPVSYADSSGNTIRLTWHGFLDPTFFPPNASTIGVDYDFIIGQGAFGTYSWTLHDVIGGQTLDRSSTGLSSATSAEYTGSLSLPVTSVLSNTWLSELDIFWTPISGGDISINVPASGSIDLSVTPTAGVPEPASLGVLWLGAAALLVRRRRKV